VDFKNKLKCRCSAILSWRKELSQEQKRKREKVKWEGRKNRVQLEKG